MKKPVIVTGDGKGNVVVLAKENKEFGHIRVEQKRNIVDEKGWLTPTTVSALIHGKVSQLREMGLQEKEAIDGKIIVIESMTPFNTKEPKKDIKIAGKTGIVCSVNGEPIYRTTRWTEDNRLSDELIEHDNTDEIRAAFLKLKEKEDLEKSSADDKATLNKPE